MTLASGSMCSVMTLAASFISAIAMSGPPETLNSTPLAPSIETSSRGELIAIFAASIALSSPLALPMPIKAEPELAMMAFTSAKSTLMTPGMVIKSDIP